MEGLVDITDAGTFSPVWLKCYK